MGAGGQDHRAWSKGQPFAADTVGLAHYDVNGARAFRLGLDGPDVGRADDSTSVVRLQRVAQSAKGVPPMVQGSLVRRRARVGEVPPELAAELVGGVEKGDGCATLACRSGSRETRGSGSDDENVSYGHPAHATSPLGSRSCWTVMTSPSDARR